MHIVITGATGFLGRSLIGEIERNNLIDKAYCIVRDVASFCGDGLKKCIAVRCDLETINELEHLSADVCIHMAGVTDELAADEEAFHRTNIQGTENVVAFCKKNGISKLVLISSVHVYLSQKGVYAASKLAAEDVVIRSGLDYSILRLATVYGPGCKFVDTIVHWMKRFHVVPIFQGGKAMEQPIFIRDATAQILFYALSESGPRIQDLYGRTAMPYLTMLETIASVIGARVYYVNLPLALTKRAVRIMQRLHLRPPVSSEQIAHMSEDLQTHDPRFRYDPNEFKRNLSNYLLQENSTQRPRN